jgi:hypothetical protein
VRRTSCAAVARESVVVLGVTSSGQEFSDGVHTDASATTQ